MSQKSGAARRLGDRQSFRPSSSTWEDHIAPWKAAYVVTQFYSGPVRLHAAASGHIAGVVNPPAARQLAIELRHLRYAVAVPKRGSKIEEWENIARWRAISRSSVKKAMTPLEGVPY
jgi:poly(3-hydroxyalkanoate) synthetase